MEGQAAVAVDRLLTVEELADVLRVPRSWVYDRTSRELIPHLHAGHYVRFSLPDVLGYLEAHGKEG